MDIAATPLPTAPKALLAKLRVSVPLSVVPPFELAISLTQKKFAEDAEFAGQAVQAETEGSGGVSLGMAISNAIRNFRGKLIEALDVLSPDSSHYEKFNLSLIEDEQMQTQLACEKLVERLGYLQRKGLLALDQRLCKILEQTEPLGLKLPLTPQVFADAARESLAEAALTDEFMAEVISEFDLILDPVLSDLLKDYNAGLAAAGILPNLVVQDEEERIRRQTINVPTALAETATNQENDHSDNANAGNDNHAGGDAGNGASNAHYDRRVEETDRNLFQGLIEQLKHLQTRNPPPPPTQPQRAMAKTETLAC